MKKLIPKAQQLPEPKKERNRSRAPAQEPVRPDRVSIPQKIIASLATILTDDDLLEVAEVYRRGLRAKQRIWVDNAWTDEKGRLRGEWREVDDFRTQKACADMIAAYKEGLPVQRQAILVQKFESIDETRARVSESPEMLKVIGNLSKLGVAVISGGEEIEIETETVQESGRQN